MRLLVAADAVGDRALTRLLSVAVADGHRIVLAVPGPTDDERLEYVGDGVVTLRTLTAAPHDEHVGAVALARLGLGTAQVTVQRDLLAQLGPATAASALDDVEVDAVLGWQAATPHVRGVLHHRMGHRPTLVHLPTPTHPALRSGVLRRWLRLHRVTAPSADTAALLERMLGRPVAVLRPDAL